MSESLPYLILSQNKSFVVALTSVSPQRTAQNPQTTVLPLSLKKKRNMGKKAKVPLEPGAEIPDGGRHTLSLRPG